MKVLYFMNHADEGGAVLALYDLIREMIKSNNIKIIVITGKKNRFNKMLTQIGVENYSAPFKNFMSSKHSPKFLWKILFRIRHDFYFPIAVHKIEKVIDFADIDIIHTNLNRIDIGAYFSKKYNIPHIWHIREHAKGDFELLSIYKDYIKYMNSFNSYFVVISNSVKRIWIKRGIYEPRVRLIYDGVRTEEFAKIQKKQHTKIKMLFLGGYNGNKGQVMFIEALGMLDKNYLKNIQVDFYGNELKKVKKKLMKKIFDLQLQNVVTLHDYDFEIYKKISDYDVGVNCSIAEGFGRVTVEYMMAGLCPLVSNAGANIEIVKDNSLGLVFGDEDDLIEKVKYIVNNQWEIKEISSRACVYAKERYSMKIHSKHIYELYKELYNKGK